MKKKVIIGYVNKECESLIKYCRYQQCYRFDWTLASQAEHLTKLRKVKEIKKIKITIEEV